jgi:DNA-binding MarR family transcriptional regulator
MADINGQTSNIAPGAEDRAAGGACAPFCEDGLFEYAELLFFAYRDFTGDPDALLAEDGFGRAHHRVVHFVNRYPGMRVAQLLDILNITKQSLGRVLKQLIDRGYVAQQAGDSDRRERRLYVTETGRALAARLAAPQLERLQRALPASQDGKDAVRAFLAAMTSEEELARRLAISEPAEEGSPP